MSDDELAELRSAYEIEARIVQQYETQIAALFSGIVILSGIIVLQASPARMNYLLLPTACLGAYLSIRICLGRAFHYGLYEDYRKHWLKKLNCKHVSVDVEERQSTHSRREQSFLQLPHYYVWPAASFLVPFLAMCIGAAK